MVKKLFTILFMLFAVQGFAQDYHFIYTDSLIYVLNSDATDTLAILKFKATDTDNYVLTYNSSTGIWSAEVAPGAAGGDNVEVNSGATVDPDFVSTGNIDFTNTSNTITANIEAASILETDLNVTNSPTDNYLLSYNTGGSNFTWVVSPGGMTAFIVEDGDGTEVSISQAKEWKFVEGAGIDINWTDITPGSDADPFDLTFTAEVTQAELDAVAALVDTDDEIIAIINASPSTQIVHEAGGLEADVNAYDGLIGITGGSTYNQTGTTTQIIIFDGAGAPTSAAISADATMSNAGVFDITQSVLEDGGTDELAITAGMMNTGTSADLSTFWRGDDTWGHARVMQEVRNVSGSAIAAGKWVYVTGGVGPRLTIGLASNAAYSTSHVIGIVNAQINNNANGDIVLVGTWVGNTTDFSDGDEQYLGTSGDAVTSSPGGEAISVFLGHVSYDHVSAGQIEVTIDHPAAWKIFHADSNYARSTSRFFIGDTTEVDSPLVANSTIAAGGTITATGSFIIGSADMAEADLEKLDGITDGTAAANKALVLDASSDIATINSLTATTLVGALTGNADTATLAATVTIADNENASETNAVVFLPNGDLDGGDLALESDGTFNYNPSTGTVTATTFVGALTGTASAITVADNEATAETNAILFSPGGDLDGGNYTPESDGDLTYTPNTGNIAATQFGGITSGNLVDKSASEAVTGNWVMNANLSVGNAASTAGVLTLLEDDDDGSNFASFMVPALGANTVYTLPADDGDAGQVLQSNGSGVLSWEADATAGAPTWDTISDPTNSGLQTITFDNAEASLLTGDNDAAVSFFTLQNSDADHTGGNIYLLHLDYSADDGDVDADFIKLEDSGSIVMTIQQNGDIATDGVIGAGGAITATGSFIIGGADMAEADLEKLDGITDGAGAANKALVLDGSADIASGLANLTASATIGGADLTASDDVIIQDDLQLDSDAALLQFGEDQDVVLTHVADTGILMALDRAFQFGDAAVFIESDDDSFLDLDADGAVRINAPQILFPNSASDVALTAAGHAHLNTTDEQLSFHSAADGEISGEVALSFIKHLSTGSFDPGLYYDSDTQMMLMTVGDDFPEGLTIDEWSVSCNVDPDTEMDLDLVRATAWIGLGSPNVIDVLDTTNGASTEDTDANINGGAVVANGQIIYLSWGADPEGTCQGMIFEMWFHGEED